MGRKATPTALRLVKGNPGKRPLNHDEPQFDLSIPTPPEHLCDEGKVEWGRVAEMLYRAGMLASVDRAVLAAYCEAYGIWQQATAEIRKLQAGEGGKRAGLLQITTNGNAIQNPLLGIANKARDDCVRFAAEFGMGPAARARTRKPEPFSGDKPAKDTAAEFFGS